MGIRSRRGAIARSSFTPPFDPGPEPPVAADTVAQWWANDIPADTGNLPAQVTGFGESVNRWVDRVGGVIVETQYDSGGLKWLGEGATTIVYYDATFGSNYKLQQTNGITSSGDGCIIIIFAINETSSSPALNFNLNLMTSGYSAPAMAVQLAINSSRITTTLLLQNGASLKAATGSADYYPGFHVLEISQTGSALSMRIDNDPLSISVGPYGGFGATLLTTQWADDAGPPGSISWWCSNTDYGFFGPAFIMIADSPLSSEDRTDLYDWINGLYGVS